MSKFGVFTVFLVAGTGVYGYINNILLIFQRGAEPLSTLGVLRIIGVLAPPLGAILGFIK